MRKPTRSFMPMPTTLNTEAPIHLLQENECPYVTNAELGDGVIRKRDGINVRKEFGEDITGYFAVSDTHALVITDTGSVSKVYEWDYGVTFTELTVPEAGTLATGTKFSGCLHVDSVIGTRFVISNGIDPILLYDETNANPALSLTYLFTDEKADLAANIRGKFVASLKGALYIAHTYEWSGAAWVSFPFRIRFSSVDDATAFANVDIENRPENGSVSPITSLVGVKDYLLLGKVDMLWSIQPYINYNCIWDALGVQNNKTITGSMGQIYFLSSGNMYALDGTMISQPIDKQLRGAMSEIYALAASEEDRETHRIHISTINKSFVHDTLKQSWTMNEFNSGFRILGRCYVADLLVNNLIMLNLQNTILAEIFMPSRLCFSLGDQWLVTLDGGYSDDGAEFTVGVKFKWDSCGDPDKSKHFRQVTIQATPATVWTIEMAVSESPEETPTYVSLGTVTCDAYGFGAIDCNTFGVWYSLYLHNFSITNAVLQKAGVLYTPRAR